MTERTLLPPDHPDAPKYWMLEIGDQLRPAIMRYLENEPLEAGDVDIIRAYLRQWIDSPVWNAEGEEVDDLRRKVREIRTRSDVCDWIEDALDLGIDPL